MGVYTNNKHSNWEIIFLSDELPDDWVDKLAATGQKFILSPEYKRSFVQWSYSEVNYYRALFMYDEMVPDNVPFELLKSVFESTNPYSIRGVHSYYSGVHNRYRLIYNFIFEPYTLQDLRGFNGGDDFLSSDELAAKFKKYDEAAFKKRLTFEKTLVCDAVSERETHFFDAFVIPGYSPSSRIFNPTNSVNAVNSVEARNRLRYSIVSKKLGLDDINAEQLGILDVLEYVKSLCQVHCHEIDKIMNKLFYEYRSTQEQSKQLTAEQIEELDDRLTVYEEEFERLDKSVQLSEQITELTELLSQLGKDYDLDDVKSYLAKQQQIIRDRSICAESYRVTSHFRGDVISKRDRIDAKAEGLCNDYHELYGAKRHMDCLITDIDALISIFKTKINRKD